MDITTTEDTPPSTPVKVDHKPDKLQGKVDIATAYRLRYHNRLTLQEIADIQGVKKQSVHKALERFQALIPNAESLQTYRDNKAQVLEGVEFELVSDLTDPARRKAASLNNVAYAVGTVGKMLLLERGQSTENVASVGEVRAFLSMPLEDATVRVGHDKDE